MRCTRCSLAKEKGPDLRSQVAASAEHVQVRREAALKRHLKPGIFIEPASTGEGEASAWLQHRAQIGKSAGWLSVKKMTPGAKKEIESDRIEAVGRRVGAYKFDRGARRQPLERAPASGLKRQRPAPARKGQHARRARSSSHRYRKPMSTTHSPCRNCARSSVACTIGTRTMS